METEKKKNNPILMGLLFLFVGIAAVGIISDAITPKNKSDTISNSKHESSKVSMPKTKEVEPDLGYAPDEFKRRFNAAARELNSDYQVSRINVENGEVNNTFTELFDQSAGVMGTISKQNGNLKSVTFLATPKGTPENTAAMIIGMGIMIALSDPELTPAGRGAIFRRLGLMDDNLDFTNYSKTTTQGNIEYSFGASSSFGVMFVISPATGK